MKNNVINYKAVLYRSLGKKYTSFQMLRISSKGLSYQGDTDIFPYSNVIYSVYPLIKILQKITDNEY